MRRLPVKTVASLAALLVVALLAVAVYLNRAGQDPQAPRPADGPSRSALDIGPLDSKPSEDPDLLRESPPARVSPPVAVSSAQSLLTIEGVLVREFSSKVWGDGNDFARVQGPGRDLTSCVKSQSLNPNGKVLSEPQARLLLEIVERHNQVIGPLYVSEGKERKRALIAAVEIGRFESAVVPTVAMGDIHGQDRIRTQVREIVDGMRARLLGGMSPHEYIFAAVAQTGEDGVGRRSLVYVSRRNDPAYFKVSDALRAAEAVRDTELKSFFAGL